MAKLMNGTLVQTMVMEIGRLDLLLNLLTNCIIGVINCAYGS